MDKALSQETLGTKTLQDQMSNEVSSDEDEAQDSEHESFETKLSKAVIRRDTALVSSLMKGAEENELEALAKNTKLMDETLDCLNDEDLKFIDKLYMHVEDLDVLTKCFFYRFGVNLGATSDEGKEFKRYFMYGTWPDVNGGNIKDDQGNDAIFDLEAPWSVVGVKTVYKAIQGLPPSHIAQVKDIIRRSTPYLNNIGGGAVAHYGTYYVQYYDEDADSNSAGYCEGPADRCYELPALERTIVHELAHIIDKDQLYSGRDEFRAITGWVDEGKNSDSAKIVDFIEANASGALYEGVVDDEDKSIARLAAELLVENSTGYALNSYESNGVAQVKDRIKEAYYYIPDAKADPEIKAEAMQNSFIFKFIVSSKSSNSNVPCYRGLMPLMNRQIHQGYEGGAWYSFPNKAFDDKISLYQLRDPGEEFAELYSTYHVAAPKGSKTSAVHNDWFEKTGLHEDPQKT
ncbi:MAG: hypothetical protein FWC40_01400 [Proteobacteria bacterium]|nr:hypothetical protein [Pseudomonadota bacterium]